MKKEIYVQELHNHIAQTMNQPFYLKDIIAKVSQENKKNYMELTLIDRTGIVYAKIWEENIDPNYINLKGRVVGANFIITQDKSEKIILFITHLELIEDFDHSDYINELPRDVQQKYKDLYIKYANTVTVNSYHSLLEYIIHKDLDVFVQLPATLKGNGSFNGGLIVYTMCTTVMCFQCMKSLATYNTNPDFKIPYHSELLITASLLHAVGTIKMLKPFPEAERLKESQLLSAKEHTLTYLTQCIQKMEVPMVEEERNLLFHLIACVYDDSLKPMLREGLLLKSVSKIIKSICKLEQYIHANEKEQGSIYDERLKNYLYIFSE